MKKILFTLLVVGMAVTACQNVATVDKPEKFIPEKEMEEIMYEAILLKAARGYSLGKLTAAGIDPESFVLKKFNIDSAQYASNTAYYATQLQTYTAMNSRIKERLLAVLKVEDSLEKIEKKISDSLRLKRTRENEEKRMARMKRDSAIGNSDASKTKKGTTPKAAGSKPKGTF